MLICFVSLVRKMTSIRWRTHFTFVMDLDSSNNHLETLLFPESRVFFKTRQKKAQRERKRGEGSKKIDRKEKTTSFLKSRVTLCWWTCGAHQDEKELPRLWNSPVKINILFKPLSGKGRGKMRESERERERKGERGKEKEAEVGGQCCC